jgi:predicted RNA-binding protein with RPS1 domain
MKQLVKIMGAFTLGFGLMSCGDSPVESKDLNVDTKGNLYISIRDVNGTILTAGDSVKVTLLEIDKKPRFADSLGTITYKNLQVGSYQVLVEKEG